MFFRKALTICGLCGFILNASGQIIISGKVINKESQPLSGVTVSIPRLSVETTTDVNGNFRISGSTRIISSQPKFKNSNITLQSNELKLKLTKRSNVSLEFYSLQGKLLNSYRGILNSGLHTILSLPKVANQFSFLKVTINNQTSLYKVTGQSISALFQKSSSSITKTGTSPELKLYTDTIYFKKQGLLDKRKVITTTHDTALNSITMYDTNLTFTTATFPKIDGSTSAQPLAMVIACHFFGVSYSYQVLSDGSKRILAYSSSKSTLADSLNNTIIRFNTTSPAYRNVINGTASLGLQARLPSQDELAYADSLNVKLDIQPIALDAFVFLVNQKNPVNNITIDNIKNIYTGNTTNWHSLGGHNLPIRPYQRERNSGSQEMLISMVMKNLPIIDAPNMIVFGMTGPYNALSNDTAGICYTVYFYGLNMAPDVGIKFLKVNGVFPDYNSIASKSYPLWADVYLVTRSDLSSQNNAAHLKDWLLATQGQRVVKQSGYVPIIDK